MVKVAHIALRYSPYEKADLHRELSSRPGFGSICIVKYLIDKGRPHSLKNVRHYKTVGRNMLKDLFYRIADRVFPAFTERQFMKFSKSALREFAPDIIHAHFGMAGVAAMGLEKSVNTPMVVSFYGVDVSQCIKDKYWVENYKILFDKADRLVVLCNEAKRRLEAIGCPERKLRVWNCLVDLEGYPYKKREDNGALTKFLVAARFVGKKGYDILLDAFKKFLDDGHEGRLTAIGYGPLKTKIEEDIRKSGLSDRVSLIDSDKIEDFYATFKDLLYSHDIFLQASVTSDRGDDEGGPALSLIYAQASGMPVITSDFAGSERSVVDGLTGLVYPLGSVEGLKEKMVYLSDRMDERYRLGYEGSRYVKSRFSVNGQTDEMVGIYNEVLKETGRKWT